MRSPTISKLPIVANCPSSWALPHAREAEASAPASRGTAIHDYLAAVGEVGREAALEQVPDEYREACEVIDTDRLPTHLAREVSFRLDLGARTATEVGRDIHRAYGKEEGLHILYGTADLVGLDADGETVVVYDYKSGWGRQDAAADHWQLRGLALAAALAYGRTHARVGIIRVPETGRPSFDVDELDAFDLDTIEVDLCAVLDQVAEARDAIQAGRTPEVTTGRHCRYCPAFHACPAQVGLIRAAASDPDALDQEIAALLTADNAAAAYRRISEVKMVLDKVTKQIETLAEQAPIPLGGTRMLGIVERKREKISGDVALPVLREHYGADVADAAVEVSITKTRLRDALRGYAQRTDGKITHIERDALKLIRQANGIEVTTSRTVGEYDAAPAELAAGGVS